MNILWISNITFPEAEQILTGNGVLKNSGGWLLGSASAISKFPDLKLTIASVTKLVKKLTYLKGERWGYYLIPWCGGNEKVNNSYNRYWKLIQNELHPDVVHIHGTEYSHGLSYIRECGSQNVVVSIQGLTSVCYKHFLADIPFWRYIINITPRDILKGNVITDKFKFKHKGDFEVSILKNINHIIGRTSWDRAHSWEINPCATYYHCNETLRPEFYSNKWSYENCCPHTIFLSQGTYPIKGLHKVINALPLILREYPDTVLRVAGIDITRGNGVKSFFLRSSYGQIVKRLLKKKELVGHIVFTGNLDAEGMKKEFLSANVFVCPSSIENSPNSLGEAQLLGVPSISSFVGGAPDMSQGTSTLLYRFEDETMLAFYICKIFEMKDKYDNNKDIECAKVRHSSEKNASDLINIYKQIIESI